VAEMFIMAIDQGTTSSRAIIFNHAGQIVSSGQLEHEQIFPRAGWVEHNPDEIRNSVNEVMGQAFARARINRHQIAAVGITNQRETTLVWDRETGEPVYNAIVWRGQDRFRAQTGLPLATYFSGPKIKWILDNVNGVAEAAARGDALFGNIDTWVIWNLTGGPNGGAHVTDVTNASRTLLMNLRTLDWDEDILRILGIPRQMLPAIRPSSDGDLYGYTLGKVPVCGDLGDQQAALVGQTCFQSGEAKNTYGTGCFMLLHTGSRPMSSAHGLLTTVAGQRAGHAAAYALEGSVAIAGALVQWLRDNLGLIRSAPEIETLARSVEDNGGLYFVPAFSGLYAPHWRDDARGVIAGLTRFANRGHLARAVLEATAFQAREVLDAMIQDSGIGLAELKVDGGMVANELLMQFQADLLNVPVVRPRVTETTALGAAYMAGLACGYWRDEVELEQNWQVDKVWRPEMGEEERERLYGRWRKAVDRTLNWIEPDSPPPEP